MDRKLDDKTWEEILQSGLFPMSTDAVDEFTPSIYDVVDKSLRPVFMLKPFTQKQSSEYQRLQNSATMSMRREAMKLTEPQKEEMTQGLIKQKKESDADFEHRKAGIIGYKLAVMYEDKIPFDKLRDVACGSIVGWANFLDSKGKKIAYKGGKSGLDVNLRQLLHSKVINEITGRLEKISGLSEIDVVGLG